MIAACERRVENRSVQPLRQSLEEFLNQMMRTEVKGQRSEVKGQKLEPRIRPDI